MNWKFFLAAFFLLACLGLLVWHFWPKAVNMPVEEEVNILENPKIVAFGDSLILGHGATPGNDMPTLLSRRVGEPIDNYGKGGDTTDQGLARIDQVLVTEPDIAIVLFGGNDFLQRIPPAKTFANLREIIEKFKAQGTAVVLLGIRGGIFQDNYAVSFERLAQETGAVYVPNVLEGLLGNDAYMSDAVHPNDQGYQMIADRLAPVLEELIGR